MTYISGYLLQRTSQNTTILHGITKTDIKGNIPNIIVD